MAMIDRLFQTMLAKKANILQLTTEEVPVLRVGDQFIELKEDPALPADMMLVLLQNNPSLIHLLP